MRSILSLALTALLPSVGAAQGRSKPVRTGYVPANGVNYYYEIHGRGEPLLILHGGLGSIDMFEPGLPEFAKHRLVIAVDLHGHGRTALGDRPISLPAMGDDMATVVKQLGYDSVDVLGYSMGGGVALRMAIQHPAAVRRLALVSTPFAQDGFYPEMLPQQAALGAAMADAMKETPMYKSYVAVAPRPQNFPRLLDQMGAWMPTAYDWSEDVKRLKGPVLLVYGDNAKDHPRWSKIRAGGVEYTKALKDAGGSVDVIDLPDVGIKGNSHMMMMDKNSDRVADLIQKWLTEKALID